MKIMHLKFKIILFFLVLGTEPAFAEQYTQWPIPMHDDSFNSKVFVDRLEYSQADKENALVWDARLWYGGDYNRLMLKTEGEDTDPQRHVSVDLLFSHLISPYWDIQVGLAAENLDNFNGNNTRGSIVAGFMGLAPYWFETDAMLYVSQDGDVSSTIEAEYEWLFTQRLILQARVETLLAVQKVTDYSVYKGINYLETGLRLRFEIMREVAPYIGVNFTKLLGNAAKDSHDDAELATIVGLRLWF